MAKAVLLLALLTFSCSTSQAMRSQIALDAFQKDQGTAHAASIAQVSPEMDSLAKAESADNGNICMCEFNFPDARPLSSWKDPRIYKGKNKAGQDQIKQCGYISPDDTKSWNHCPTRNGRGRDQYCAGAPGYCYAPVRYLSDGACIRADSIPALGKLDSPTGGFTDNVKTMHWTVPNLAHRLFTKCKGCEKEDFGAANMVSKRGCIKGAQGEEPTTLAQQFGA